MEPRNRATPGCRRAPNTRKATARAPLWQGVPAPGGVGDLWHARKHCVRNPGGPASGLAVMPGPHGEPAGHDRDARVQGVGPLHSTEEAFEQRLPQGTGGGGGGKGAGQGERGGAYQGPDTGPGHPCHTCPTAFGRHLRVPARQTRGRSPVRECRTPGSVRGVPGNRHPYRDCLQSLAS
jgi:hypothetical protein